MIENDPQTASGPPAGATDDAPPPRKRRGPPWWGVLAFIGLLAGMGVVNFLATTGGPAIQWVDGGLDVALKAVTNEKPRVFLYLCEANDQARQRNELQVFSKRWARDPLRYAVCCRVVLGNDAESAHLRSKYAYTGKPLFLLLTRDGTPVSRTEGEVDERMFSTYIGKPILQAVGKKTRDTEP